MRTPLGTKVIPVRWLGADCFLVDVVSRVGACRTHVSVSSVICESDADSNFIRTHYSPSKSADPAIDLDTHAPKADPVLDSGPELEPEEMDYARVPDHAMDTIETACEGYAQHFLSRVRQGV